MALLAEGKKKTKFGLDPQNTNWSNDTNKFGQRLMEKMGWEKGKGLGANENGMTEHIKASYKWDQSGLGASPQSADAWVAHQDDYNDLLKMLNSGNQDQEPKEKNETSQDKEGSKRYYGRFARGRVQKLRTTEDLDCIFGRRKSASAPTTPSNQSAANSGDDDSSEDGTTEKSHGLTTVTSTTSVQDYFANKMREMKARQMKTSTSEDSTGGTEKSNEIERRKNSEPAVYGMVTFSYGDSDKEEGDEKDGKTVKKENKENPSRGWYQSWNLDHQKEEECAKEEIEDESRKSKSKKKKKDKKAKPDVDIPETSKGIDKSENVPSLGSTEQTENTDTLYEDLERRKLSKKKKKRKAEQDSEVSEKHHKRAKLEDDQSTESRNMERVDVCDDKSTAPDSEKCDELESSSKKKKKKRKAEKELEDSVETERDGKKRISGDDSGPSNEEERSEKKSKKKKRKDKSMSKSVSCSESVNVDPQEHSNCDPSLQSLDSKSEKKKKKSKSKTDNLDESKDEDVRLNNETDAHPNHGSTVDKTGDNSETESIGLAETSSSNPSEKRRDRKYKKKKKQEKKKQVVLQPEPVAKPKKSIFPGSNIEDLHGYAEIKAMPKDQVDKVEKAVKGETSRKRKLVTAKDVHGKLRDIAKLQGGMVGHSQ